jgi:hypothetical protein
MGRSRPCAGAHGRRASPLNRVHSAAVRRHRCKAIIHLASPLPPETEEDATATVQQMTQSHINVLEAARMFGVRRVVYASASASILGRVTYHGGIDVAVANDTPHHPETLCGICKSTNERIAALYWNRFGIDSIGACESPRRTGQESGAVDRPSRTTWSRSVCAAAYFQFQARCRHVVPDRPTGDTGHVDRHDLSRANASWEWRRWKHAASKRRGCLPAENPRPQVARRLGVSVWQRIAGSMPGRPTARRG